MWYGLVRNGLGCFWGYFLGMFKAVRDGCVRMRLLVDAFFGRGVFGGG